jgi:conjugal transfer/type IV secretion protein DotA/TraY
MGVSAGKVLKYTLLPGIVPRTTELFASGFSHVSLFMALAFRIADLLPPNHPYLNPANTGRFGIRQVLSEARRNLVFRRENLDQIIMYYTIMIGLFLIFTQFVMLIFSLTLHAANATSFPNAVGFGPWIGQFFGISSDPVYSPNGDVAFIMLDRIFGFLDPSTGQAFYGSCADKTIPCPTILTIELKAQPGDVWPTPFHAGLHMLYNFYDLGVAAVGLIIFTYLVATVTAETAQTGIPFGKRFNHTWVIPRLIVAVVLLIPWDPYTGPPGNTSYINGAQAITLHVAKWGSNLATNGWILFNNKMVAANAAYTLGGLPANMVVNPNPPSYNNFAEFMTLAKTCKYAEERITQEAGQPAIKIDAYQIDNVSNTEQVMPTGGGAPADFNSALTFSKNKDIVIVFGELNATAYTHDLGGVKPICGKTTVHITDLSTPGAMTVQSEYYEIIANLWVTPDATGCTLDTFAQNIVERFTPNPDKNPGAPIPTAAFAGCMKTWMNNAIKTAVTDGHAAEVADPNWAQTYKTLGWGGAAIWYNKLADYNGSYVTSVFNLPSVDLYPEVMEYIKEQHQGHHADDSGMEAFRPVLGDNERIFYRKPAEDNIAQALYYTQSFWFDQYQNSSGNPVVDYLKAIFGVQGVYNMLDNLDVNPMAQLVGLGKGLMEATAIQLTGRILFGVMGDAAGRTQWGAVSKAIGKMMETIVTITFSVGFTLYYVLPFLPFVYFFFAVGSWVKAVFEAMVGMPLWALSFVNIEGEGLPGKSGMNGFYLLLEILLRPILIIFGLIAGVSIFTAQVSVLHEIWYLVLSNLGGADTANAQLSGTAGESGSLTYIRDTIDDFIYTCIYTIFVYMMAMASFKLIDMIPAKILRWVGASVNTFGSSGDPGRELMKIGKAGAGKSLSPINDALK